MFGVVSRSYQYTPTWSFRVLVSEMTIRLQSLHRNALSLTPPPLMFSSAGKEPEPYSPTKRRMSTHAIIADMFFAIGVM